MKTIKNTIWLSLLIIGLIGCKEASEKEPVEIQSSNNAIFVWEGANLYFLLTDRFNNGDESNDVNFNRNEKTAISRGFEGGDIRGIIQKIDEGYFEDLGINAIWFTPVLEQIYGNVDEGTGISYGYHGYWTKDWTSLDPNFGTREDLEELIEKAHDKGIRILMDAIINHTGPVTEFDPVWPDNWVRTGPVCDYETYESTINCTLVENLPDIRTESNASVEVPEHLANKWKKEGRFEQEMKELDDFFERTGYPKAPRFYIIKWLTDYISDFGIDGYRADTVRHVEESVWEEFKTECEFAFAVWKKNNPDKVMDNNNFFLVGEVYNLVISEAKAFDFGDKKVNYYDFGFDAMINFEFKTDAQGDYETMFNKYSEILNYGLPNSSVLNYVTSHDDSSPYDIDRLKPYEAGTKLLLCPGISQVYYGDESSRSLHIEDAKGDANLRSFMNWADLENNEETKMIFDHWKKLGKFRQNHPSIGAGKHEMITQSPYVFSRVLQSDTASDSVIIGLDLNQGPKEIVVSSIFKDGDSLVDKYSNNAAIVKDGRVTITSNFDIVLLELN